MNKRAEHIRTRKSPFYIADAVVFALAVALAVILPVTLSAKKGNYVEICSPDIKLTLPLSEDATHRLDGCLTVVIKDGACFVTEAECRNRVCQKTGKISKIGESIVCAQFGIVISVTGKSKLAGTVGKQ